jgi:hypothetical protein
VRVLAWRAYKLLVEQMAEREERLIGLLGRLDRTLERNSAALTDLRDQVHANTQATLRLLDRLDGGEQPA